MQREFRGDLVWIWKVNKNDIIDKENKNNTSESW